MTNEQRRPYQCAHGHWLAHRHTGEMFCHECALADAERRGAERAWRVIETAPRDGTHVLLFTTDHGQVEAWFDPGEWTEHYELGREYSGPAWVCGDDAWQIEVEAYPDDHPDGVRFHDGTATHWMPLPTPPTEDHGNG